MAPPPAPGADVLSADRRTDFWNRNGAVRMPRLRMDCTASRVRVTGRIFRTAARHGGTGLLRPKPTGLVLDDPLNRRRDVQDASGDTTRRTVLLPGAESLVVVLAVRSGRLPRGRAHRRRSKIRPRPVPECG